jgi:hypothetical protein
LACAGAMSSEALSRTADSDKAFRMDEGKPPPTREERLAAKLRENLRRRKAQARDLERKDDGLPKAPDPG